MNFGVDFRGSRVIPDLVFLSPDTHIENRGKIWTSYERHSFSALRDLDFVHDKFSTSKRNVLRGIHGDFKTWKLVSCPFGEITAVFVDMRENSSGYLRHEKINLTDKENTSVLVPPGVGNSFYVHSDIAVYHYKLAYTGQYADADEQFTIAWNDSRFDINWPCDNPILSERDGRFE